jgi:ubiquinone/menaquinone biosynthesis C-methylase UbiE
MTTERVSSRATEIARRRYDRVAVGYDQLEAGIEKLAYRHWRKQLWSMVDGGRVLEVGVGTGKNIPYYSQYSQSMQVTGIDLSRRMLEHARNFAQRTGADVELREMDVEHLAFPSGSFDAVLATFVFCSVPNPVAGLREIRRVLRPQGRLFLLEHVLSHKRVLRPTMRLLNPVAVRLMGANIDRETRANLENAGFRVEVERDLWLDVFKFLVAVSARDHA